MLGGSRREDVPCHPESSEGWPTAGLLETFTLLPLPVSWKALHSQGDHGGASGQKEVAGGMFTLH